MPLPPAQARGVLLADLNDEQQSAVSSDSRRLLVVAGAGSGKTEVMARRVAWWIAVNEVSRDEIVAFTFTEAAAEELKFRIRNWMERISEEQEDPTLGGMYIGTIHGFCLHGLDRACGKVHTNRDSGTRRFHHTLSRRLCCAAGPASSALSRIVHDAMAGSGKAAAPTPSVNIETSLRRSAARVASRSHVNLPAESARIRPRSCSLTPFLVRLLISLAFPGHGPIDIATERDDYK